MQTQKTDLSLGQHLRILRRRWLTVGLTVIACGAIALAISLVQQKSYQAEASLGFTDPNSALSLIGGSYISTQTPLQLAAAAAPEVTRQEVVSGVKTLLNTPLTDAQLQDDVSVTIDPNSYLVDITATARHPLQAARIANAFATVDTSRTNAEARHIFALQAAALARKLRATGAIKNPVTDSDSRAELQELRSLSSVAAPVTISATASPPGSPSAPKPARNVAAGIALGLLLGILLAYARNALDRRLRGTTDVSQIFDDPVVGHIRREALGHAGPFSSGSTGPLEAPDEESFRVLRQNVQYLSAANNDGRTVLVTSSIAEEGKSTVAACLAVSMAVAGRKTLLVECDLRRPVLATRFGIDASPGLTDYLTGHAEPGEILQAVDMTLRGSGLNGTNGSESMASIEEQRLVCITAGSQSPRPAELLASTRFQTFLAEVGSVYDIVVIDSAPMLVVADTHEIVPYASSVLLCLRLDQTTRDQARTLQAALSRLPAPPLGLVLTNANAMDGGYYGYYGYYASPTATES
jgi:Mrp family chromosome partitioning ATPase/capsular polysaccharide biosynthesis protein